MTTERFHSLLAGIIEVEVGFNRDRAIGYAMSFSSLKEFITVPKEKLFGPIGVSGKPTMRIKKEQIEAIDQLRKQKLDGKKTVSDNYISAISRRFATRQIEMIQRMNLKTLNVNPLLVNVLNIHTPLELVSFHVEAAATRSIVTSMGFYLEQLVWASSDTIEKAPRTSNWDFNLTRGGKSHWLQIKSGTNDMDKDQIVHWAEKIKEKIVDGEKAYLGFAYGKKSDDTVSLGLLKKYLPDWEMRVLVGKELWQFVSNDSRHHRRVCNILRQTALTVLHKSSIVSEMDAAIKRITSEFEAKYGRSEKAVEKYVQKIL
jgi:hypothetical protein